MEYFERPASGERALLLHVHIQDRHNLAYAPEDPEEFRELALAAGVQVVDYVRTSRQVPDSRFFAGSGKVEELRERVLADGVDVLLVDNTLSPAQERNLERALSCRVIDRTGLILDIFAQRARTHEGQLQVELAQLEHLSTRLVRGWTHLERQKGGIGLRGPGETQLETDRRLLRQRVAQLRQRLEDVRRTRSLGRAARVKSSVPTVALVGYTNAGKSTLFNRLCASDVFAADMLFATLDPTLRRLELPGIGPIVLVDTVGFIRQLPHQLVDAFRATLEETLEADLLLHVLDAASPERDRQRQAVLDVLSGVGAEEVPLLEVLNKIDLLNHVEPHVACEPDGRVGQVWISAQQGLGMPELLHSMSSRLELVPLHPMRLPPSLGGLRAAFYAHQAVESERIDDEGFFWLDIRMETERLQRLVQSFGVVSSMLEIDAVPDIAAGQS